jgi:hypothetical protein
MQRFGMVLWVAIGLGGPNILHADQKDLTPTLAETQPVEEVDHGVPGSDLSTYSTCSDNDANSLATDGTDDPSDSRCPSVEGIVFRYVQAGDFKLGSANGEADQRPAHGFSISPFCVTRDWITDVQSNYLSGITRQCFTSSQANRLVRIASNRTKIKFRLISEPEWEYIAKKSGAFGVAHIFQWWERTGSIYMNYPYSDKSQMEASKDGDANQVVRGGQYENDLSGVPWATLRGYALPSSPYRLRLVVDPKK